MNPVPWFAPDRANRETLEFRRNILNAGQTVKNTTLGILDNTITRLKRAHIFQHYVYVNAGLGESLTASLYPQIDPNGYGVMTNNNFTADDFSERPTSKAGNVEYSETFDSGTGGFGTASTVTLSNPGGFLRVTGDGSSLNPRALKTNAATVNAGTVLKITGRARAEDSAQTLRIGISGVGSGQVISNGTTDWVDFDVNATTNSSGSQIFLFWISGGGSTSLYGDLDNVQIEIVSQPPGWQCDGSTKYFEAPLSPNDVGATGGLGAWVLDAQDNGSTAFIIGTQESLSATERFHLYETPAGLYTSFYGGNSEIAQTSDISNGLIIGRRSSNTDLSNFLDGVKDGTDTTSKTPTPPTNNYFIFSRNNGAGTAVDFSQGRFGLAFFTDGQIPDSKRATEYAIWRDFQQALGRVS